MRTGASLWPAAAAVCRTAAVVLIASGPLAAQSVVFSAPAADTTWDGGLNHDIQWQWRGSEEMRRTLVRLSYRMLPDGGWTEIGSTQAGRQQYRWQVPRDAAGSAQIRAVWAVYAFEHSAYSPPFVIRNRQPTLEIPRGGVSRASDYSVGEAFFEGPRPLSEGVMYDPDAPNYMTLMVRIDWNGVAGRYGIQCDNHRLTVFYGPNVIFNPGRVPPVPAGARSVDMRVPIRLPSALRPGSNFPFRVRLRPGDADCDADGANNERTFTTRLVRMGGNDLVVRIVSVDRVYNAELASYDVKIVTEVMNVSGAESLADVEIRFNIEGHNVRTAMATLRQGFLRPGVWTRITESYSGGSWDLVRGRRYRAVVTVDPDNEVRELREDNNTDGKWFVW